MDRAFILLGRLRRAHAMLLTCTCAVIGLVNVPSRNLVLPSVSWSNSTSANEAEIVSPLQHAAETALGDREGSIIIIIDAQTGRVRAAVNPEAAYAQAMMPGSSLKPFTTLAALRAGLI